MYSVMMATMFFASTSHAPALGIDGTDFTLDGKPTFLLGASYYGALGIEDTRNVKLDLDDLGHCGFNWIRVWATWKYDDDNMSAVAADGAVRQPYMDRLERVCELAGQRGFVVDVTVTRGKAPHFPSTQQQHLNVITTLSQKLQRFRNVYFDVANERNIGDDRYVSMTEVGELIAAVKKSDPNRLCTASQGGDIASDEVTEYITVGKVDFLCPHRARGQHSPIETEAKTRAYLTFIKAAPRSVPVHYQEPFRRGYNDWNPVENDFTTDLRGARVGGAAGWCFHNGASRETKNGRPRRSFDMRPAEGRLFKQLDSEEQAFLARLRESAN
ncbi:MAG: cellulase family glycosylhydrolase [Candidatus Hydrogenedentes bacterium]|nr:cellulase family glycosylhydrolase [Candidatus Hydrogenedentota bacterium]